MENKYLESLQNFANRFGLVVHIQTHEDKRKKDLYFLQQGTRTVSPPLDYDGLNHFMLGILCATEKL